MTELEKELGQLLMIGLKGEKLNEDEEEFIRNTNPSGVTYFRRNIGSAKQIARLSKKLYSVFPTPPFIAIDQEGGRVARLSDPFTVFPGNAAIGSYFAQTQKLDLLRKQCRAMIKELKSIGVNLNFVPVLDVHTNPKNPIIGDRAFASNSRSVAKLGEVMVREFNKGQMISCGKHFPGHGDTASDSHKVLPVVKTSKRTLAKRELVPFQKAIAAGVPMIMTAHVIYKELDPRNTATLSKSIIGEVLRKKLNFQGVVVSDDLEMNAISKKMSLSAAALKAFDAGVDVFLICKSLAQAKNVHQSFLKALRSGTLDEQRLQESLQRVKSLKRRFVNSQFYLPQSFTFSWPEHRVLAERIDKFAKLRESI